MKCTQNTQSGKMFSGLSVQIKDKTSSKSSRNLQRPKFLFLDLTRTEKSFGQMPEWSEQTTERFPTEHLIVSIGESPNVVKESFLSSVLESNVPAKYFLSSRACLGILRRAEKRGKKLPEVLEMALRQQSSLNQEAKMECLEYMKAEYAQRLTRHRGGQRQPCIAQPIAFNGRQDPVYGTVTGAIDTDRSTQCICFGPGGSNEISHAIRAQASRADKPDSTTYVIQSATMSGDKKQNGLGVSDGPCYTLDCRADHAVCYPEPANALLAKGNLSYRADVDNLVCAVDVRNLYETEELSETLQSKQTGGYSLNYQNPVRVGYAVRRLMPIETERLMSMPDGWTDIPGASDTARYKAIGNSLVCNIAEWIFSQIVRIEIEEMLG